MPKSGGGQRTLGMPAVLFARGARQTRSGHRRAAAISGDARGRAGRGHRGAPADRRTGQAVADHLWHRPVAAITLIADLPELGLLSAKQIAALVGLAPHTKRSGKTRYRETTGHGRPGVRRVLFNAARAAVRHPSLFKDFYDRLVTDNRRPGKSLPQRKRGSPSPP